MNKTVWKFPLEVVDEQIVAIPEGAKIICIQTQYGEPVMYAEVDPNNPPIDFHIEIFGTGDNIHYGMGVERTYIGTFQLNGGQRIFHVFHYTGV